jgi:hypothetical protein
MLQPDLNPRDPSSIPAGTGQPEGDLGVDDLEGMFKQVAHPGVNGSEVPNGGGTGYEVRSEPEEDLDDFVRTPEIDPGDCVSYISRGNARYQRGDSECEADYRAAFLLDPGLAASETVRRLEDDIRDNISQVLRRCRNHLRINPGDVVARIRLGLTLLMLYQEVAAFDELRRVFLHGPVWRSSLRLLVKEAKSRRATVFARVLRRP